jgi:hypothetical protein
MSITFGTLHPVSRESCQEGSHARTVPSQIDEPVNGAGAPVKPKNKTFW